MQAVLFGGTGLTGGCILDFLNNDSDFKNIIVVSRKTFTHSSNKISNKVIDFSHPLEIESCIKKDSIVFSCIGTTQAQVQGDKKKYRDIDFDITLNIANACEKLNAKKFLFISSGGANSSSSNFYLKLKGEIEDAVINTKNNSLFILKPSLLLGKRNNSRFIENIGQIIMPLFSILLPDSIKAVKATSVAKCMLELSKSERSNLNIIENKEILTYL
ncbi:NAD(P)H-binding protein [Flavobacteriales bacterium]|nr:NAD(P)H-binding protein [Flavobacteriales bacterium]